MYKVFYNQKPIFFTTELNKISDETPLLFLKYSNQESIVKALRSKKNKGVYLYHPRAEKLEKLFIKKFPLVEAAGGLVEHKNGTILFIYRNNKWDFPKGKIEKGEVIIDAAVREVMEETGVADLVVNKPLSTTYHIYRASKQFKLKKTYWFLMKSGYSAPLRPQIEENIQMAVWKSKEEFPKLMENAFENIKILMGDIS
ncbi:MAG: NUDIX domain-containing protein [Flavobacteriaceae bacterium]